jgi:hypothetical protein
LRYVDGRDSVAAIHCRLRELDLAARIIFADRLGEVTAGGAEFSLRAAELLEQQVCKTRIRRGDAYSVLKAYLPLMLQF